MLTEGQAAKKWRLRQKGFSVKQVEIAGDKHDEKEHLDIKKIKIQ